VIATFGRAEKYHTLNTSVHRGLKSPAVHGAAAGDVDGVAHHGGAHAVARVVMAA